MLNWITVRYQATFFKLHLVANYTAPSNYALHINLLSGIIYRDRSVEEAALTPKSRHR